MCITVFPSNVKFSSFLLTLLPICIWLPPTTRSLLSNQSCSPPKFWRCTCQWLSFWWTSTLQVLLFQSFVLLTSYALLLTQCLGSSTGHPHQLWTLRKYCHCNSEVWLRETSVHACIAWHNSTSIFCRASFS